jgi:hypothetical protein
MQSPDGDQETGAGTIAALLAALVVIVAIVVLFVLLKFNFFNGGTMNHAYTSMAGLRPRAAAFTRVRVHHPSSRALPSSAEV